MRLQILGIDRQHPLEGVDRSVNCALQEQHAAELIEHDAIARILRGGARR